MRILVTGTAGFVGFHVAQSLLDDGHEVVGFDNFDPYYPVLLKQQRDAALRRAARFHPVVGDLACAADVDRLFAEARPSLVVHLAAQAGVRYSIDNPAAYAAANLQGFVHVIEASRRAGVQRFVYASSSSVYGGLTQLPYREDQAVDRPISLYAATKRANELMAYTYTHLHGLQTVGLRFFTVYGPWGRPDMAYWIFVERLLAGRPIPVFNHGNMQRDFTYIDDIVAGVKGVVFAPQLAPATLFNIGNNRSESLMRFIDVLEGTLGVRAERQLLPMQPGDVPATFADVSRLHAAVGYVPRTPIEVGLQRFVDWYRAHPDIAATVAAWRSQPARG